MAISEDAPPKALDTIQYLLMIKNKKNLQQTKEKREFPLVKNLFKKSTANAKMELTQKTSKLMLYLRTGPRRDTRFSPL